MKYIWKVVLIGSLLGSCVISTAEVEDSTALCFDERVISIHQLQHLDMLAAFETVYEIAEVTDTLDELPAGFIRCLEVIRSGDDRVRCCDFVDSIKLIIDKVLLMRGGKLKNRGLCLTSYTLEDELDEFADAVADSLCDIWERLVILEAYCGIRRNK